MQCCVAASQERGSRRPRLAQLKRRRPRRTCVSHQTAVFTVQVFPTKTLTSEIADISNILWLYTAAYSPRRHGAYLVCKHRRTADKHQPIQARESHGINTAPVTDYTTHISNSSSDQKKCSNKRITQSSFTEKPHLHD